MPHRASILATAILLAACTDPNGGSPTIGAADPLAAHGQGVARPVVSVTGHFGIRRYGAGPAPTFVQHASFVAHLSAEDGVSGHVHSLSTSPSGGTPHSSWTEEVVCLVVEGNVAWMGTVVVNTSPGAVVPVGRRYVYRMVDNGRQDLLQRGPNLTDCTLQPPVSPLLESMQGEIRITEHP